MVAALFAVTLTGCTSPDPEPTEAPEAAPSSAVPTESPTPERTQADDACWRAAGPGSTYRTK